MNKFFNNMNNEEILSFFNKIRNSAEIYRYMDEKPSDEDILSILENYSVDYIKLLYKILNDITSIRKKDYVRAINILNCFGYE